MFVRVVELFRFGVRRSTEEVKACEPLIGWLEMGPVHHGAKDQKLELFGSGSGSGAYSAVRLSILHPLFDVRIAGMAKGSMTVAGTQNATRGGVLYSMKQVWWVRPLEDQNPNTKTSDPHYHPECSRMIGEDPPLTAKHASSEGAMG